MNYATDAKYIEKILQLWNSDSIMHKALQLFYLLVMFDSTLVEISPKMQFSSFSYFRLFFTFQSLIEKEVTPNLE